MRQTIIASAAALAVIGAALSAAHASCGDSLARVAEGGALTLGVRKDAPPFSAAGADGKITGYSVALCRRVAGEVALRQQPASVRIDELVVTAENRFEALASCQIDILCEATTVTLSRMRTIAFSPLIFASGGGILYHRDGPQDFAALGGKKVGVLAGTTADDAIDEAFAAIGVEPTLVRFETHDAAIAAMRERSIEAYVADRSVLVGLAREHDLAAAGILVSELTFSYEPYALAMRKDDPGLVQVATETLARLYRSGRINEVYAQAFAGHEPGPATRTLFAIQGFPE